MQSTFDYELLDDMYSCSEWTNENKEEVCIQKYFQDKV